MTSIYLKDGRAAETEFEGSPLSSSSDRCATKLEIIVTFANKVLTNRYNKRPKISFLIRIAKLKFATAISPLYLRAYGQCPEAAKPSPIMFSENVMVKSFLYMSSVKGHSSEARIK